MKNKWLVLPALLLVMSLVFLGCDDGSKAEPIANLTEVTFDGSAITLEKVGTSDKASVSGNTYSLVSTSNEGSTGFVWVIPSVIDPENPAAKQKDYEFVEITIEIVSITLPTNGVAFNAKTSRSLGPDVNRWDQTAQYKNNLDILNESLVDGVYVATGITVGPGAKNTAKYYLNLNKQSNYIKPFEGEIAFQWNNWSDDLGGAAGDKGGGKYPGTAGTDFTIKVTSIKFIPYAGEPAAEDDPEPEPVEFLEFTDATIVEPDDSGKSYNIQAADMAAAKYLIIASVSDSNTDGYGGLQVYMQGDALNGWGTYQLYDLGNWTSFAHNKDGDEIVYMVFELAAFSDYADLKETGTAQFAINYGQAQLMQWQVYLTSKALTKPDGAADMVDKGSTGSASLATEEVIGWITKTPGLTPKS